MLEIIGTEKGQRPLVDPDQANAVGAGLDQIGILLEMGTKVRDPIPAPTLEQKAELAVVLQPEGYRASSNMSMSSTDEAVSWGMG